MDTIWIIVASENHPDREHRVMPNFYTVEAEADAECKRLDTSASNYHHGHQQWWYNVHEVSKES